MKEYREKRKIKRLLYSKFSIILLIFLLFFIAKASFHVYGKQSEAKDKRIKAEAELLRLEARKDELMNEIERLESLSGIEEEIREKFKMAKENENMVIITGDEAEAAELVENPGFFENIKNKILTIFR